MHPNYDFVLNYIREHSGEDTRSLDYGCGSAAVVCAGRAEGLDVFGCELFYEGGNTRDDVEKLGYLGSIVREITDGKMDFPDGYFNIITNNQVMEHVEDMGRVLQEMRRVLTRGGVVLSLFPSRAVWSEGHCGIPFLHKFPKGSRFRVYYALAWRLSGKGYHKGEKTPFEWCRSFCNWLDQYTYYRSHEDIVTMFNTHFESIEFREIDYLRFRAVRVSENLRRAVDLLSLLPYGDRLLTAFVRRKGGLVLVATKGSSSGC